MDFILLPDVTPFTIAIGIVVGVFIFELFTALMGMSLIGMDGEVDVDADHTGGIFTWLNPYGVPFLVLLMVFLLSLGVTGYVLQVIWLTLFKTTVTAFVAVPVSLIPTIFLTRITSGVVGRLIPNVETTAVFLESLCDSTATVTIGTGVVGTGQAKVKDEHGQTHYVRIVAENADESFQVGEDVVLLDFENHVFKARKV